MHVTILCGDLTQADTDAICTSTNRRLTLVMGTGAALRERGGYQILRQCEEIVQRLGPLTPGSAHVTTAGDLPFTIAIHCVASDASHRSSDAIVSMCVENAIARAEEAHCRSVAMPVFASGHAAMMFGQAVAVMSKTLRRLETSVQRVVMVVNDPVRAEEARAIVGADFPDVIVTRLDQPQEARVDWWSDDSMFGR